MIRVTTFVYNQLTLIDLSGTKLYPGTITGALNRHSYSIRCEVQRGIQIH